MVSCDDLPEVERRRLPRYPIPVVHLARLAVHREAQGHGLGRWLLVHALEQVLRVAEGIAVYAVEVVAMSGAARTFYERYGFRPLQDDPDPLYLSIAAIRRALA